MDLNNPVLSSSWLITVFMFCIFSIISREISFKPKKMAICIIVWSLKIEVLIILLLPMLIKYLIVSLSSLRRE